MSISGVFRDIIRAGSRKADDILYTEKRAFLKEVTAGNVAAVEAMLKENPAAVNWRDDCKITPLHAACRAGHKDLALYLLDKGARLNARERCKHTPLIDALNYYRGDIALALIERGANIHARTHTQRTAMDFAASIGRLDVVDELRRRGATFDTRNSTIHEAARSGQTHVVDHIHTHHGVSLDKKDRWGTTLLHNAAWWGCPETLQYLLDKGVDHTCLNEYGETAASLAKGRNHPEMVDAIEARSQADIVKAVTGGLRQNVAVKPIRLQRKASGMKSP